MMRRLFSPASLFAAAIATVLLIAGAAAVGASVHAGGASRSQALQNTVVTCRVQAANLRVRSGPGAAFPTVTTLPQGTVVQGISFVRTGVPSGSWVEVQQAQGRPLGFIAAEQQFVRCQPAANTLPPGRIPPTPAPERQRVSRVRTDGSNPQNEGNPVIRGPADVNSGQYIILPRVNQDWVNRVMDENGGVIRFGDALGFGVEVLDRQAGQTIGSGIQEVQFQISYFDPDSGENITAYQTVERTAPYCLFSDENGQCNVRRFSQMGYKWPDTDFGRGASRPSENTQYSVTITIVPTEGDPVQWFWQFELTPIAVEFP
jgi:hypothetical protein